MWQRTHWRRGHRSNFPRAVAVDTPCSTPATKERDLTGAFVCKTDSQKGVVCHIVPRACLPPIFSCVGSWSSKVVDADPDDRFGDFESMMHLYACVGWLASLHDWPRASSLCTSDKPAPMQFPRPKVFNVDLSLALPLTVSDLRGVAPRASRSFALPPVCHGFHEPSRACPGEEVELDCVSWQGPSRVARPRSGAASAPRLVGWPQDACSSFR